MKERVEKLRQSVDRLSLRERLFVFAAALLIIAGLWEAALAAPLAARETLANNNVGALQERLQQLDGTLSAAAAGLTEGVPEQLERLRALRERVATGEEEMRVYTTDLVDPGQMRAVLEELLRRQSGLKLVNAVNRPAEPLVLDDEPAAEATPQPKSDSDAPQLYRHSLVLTLEGSYLDCLQYLEAVERLPWHIFWTRLEVEAGEYPKNEIRLELTTLSLDEEWIGV